MRGKCVSWYIEVLYIVLTHSLRPKYTHTHTSRSEEDAKNPQVAMDEDFSSEEEPAPPTSVAIATPPAKPKTPPVKLKSAKEIVLTESEEENEELPSQPQTKAPKRKPDGDIFSTSTPATQKPSKGLLLDFDYLSSVGDTKAKPKSSGAKKDSPTTPTSSAKNDSPTTPTGERREKRRKRSKKSRHKGEKKEGGDKPPAAPVTEDPFALPPSLDAWLNAGSEESSSLVS